jgi:hypothetical protein
MNYLLLGAALEWIRNLGRAISDHRINKVLGPFLCPRRYNN